MGKIESGLASIAVFSLFTLNYTTNETKIVFIAQLCDYLLS